MFLFYTKILPFSLHNEVTGFKYLGYRTSEYKSDLEDQLKKHTTK